MAARLVLLDHKRRGYHECINANGGLGDGKDGRHAAREKRALVRFSQRAYARAPAARPAPGVRVRVLLLADSSGLKFGNRPTYTIM